MDLLQQLAEEIAGATREKSAGAAVRPLHLRIECADGERALEQARLYAAALAAAGLAKGQPPVVLDFADADKEQNVNDAFAAADGRVLVIAGAEAAGFPPGRGKSLLRVSLTQAWDLKRLTLVFTGSAQGLDGYFGQMPEMATRIPLSVTVANEPTAEEQAEENRRRIAREWRQAKAVDVAIHTPLAAPKRARFRPKNGPDD